MSMTDPVADLLTRIRNACMEKHDKVEVPASRLKANIVKVLKEEGYIKTDKVLTRDEVDYALFNILKNTDGIDLLTADEAYRRARKYGEVEWYNPPALF